jgi:hypothetical protein
MKCCAALILALAVAGASIAGAPPQYPESPAIIPTPTSSPPTTGHSGPNPPPPVPEPSTLTIALISAAAAGSFRLMRRRR